jgi:hypothetical protein
LMLSPKHRSDGASLALALVLALSLSISRRPTAVLALVGGGIEAGTARGKSTRRRACLSSSSRNAVVVRSFVMVWREERLLRGESYVALLSVGLVWSDVARALLYHSPPPMPGRPRRPARRQTRCGMAIEKRIRPRSAFNVRGFFIFLLFVVGPRTFGASAFIC